MKGIAEARQRTFKGLASIIISKIVIFEDSASIIIPRK